MMNKRKAAGGAILCGLAAVMGVSTYALFSTYDQGALWNGDPDSPDHRGTAGTVEIEFDKVKSVEMDPENPQSPEGREVEDYLVFTNRHNVNPGDDDQDHPGDDHKPGEEPKHDDFEGTQHHLKFALKNVGTKSVVTKFELTIAAESQIEPEGYLLRYASMEEAQAALEKLKADYAAELEKPENPNPETPDNPEAPENPGDDQPGGDDDPKKKPEAGTPEETGQPKAEKEALEIFIRNGSLDVPYNRKEEMPTGLKGTLDASVYSLKAMTDVEYRGKYDGRPIQEVNPRAGMDTDRVLVEITKKYVKVKGDYYYFNPYLKDHQYTKVQMNEGGEAVTVGDPVDLKFTHCLRVNTAAEGEDPAYVYYEKSLGRGWRCYTEEEFAAAGLSFCEEVKYLKSGDVYDGLGRDLDENGTAEKEKELGERDRHVQQEGDAVRREYEYAFVTDFATADEYQGADISIGLKGYATQYRNFDASKWYKIFDDMTRIQTDEGQGAE